MTEDEAFKAAVAKGAWAGMNPPKLGDVALSSHVAGLAQANKVAQRVGLSGRGEQPERRAVVNRDGPANDLPTGSASAVVALDRGEPSLNPSTPSVGSNAADPIGRLRAGLLAGLEGRMTGLAAEAPAGLCFVLPGEPGLQLEGLAAVRAIVELAGYRVQFAGPLGSEGVGGAEPLPPCVPYLVVVGHLARSHVPNTAAGLAAKASRPHAIGLHLKRLGANFANHLRHLARVARSTGVAKPAQQLSILDEGEAA